MLIVSQLHFLFAVLEDICNQRMLGLGGKYMFREQHILQNVSFLTYPQCREGIPVS